MNQLAKFLLWPLLASVAGLVVAFFARRAPMSGKLALALLLVPTLGVISLAVDDGENFFLGILGPSLFAFGVPVCLAYSFSARRRATDRKLALAGLAGAVLFALPYLFMIPQIAYQFVCEILGVGDGN